MVPYQIYQALMDEHVHELQAAARRHEQVTEIRLATAGRARRAARVKGAVGRLAALAHLGGRAQVHRSARPGSTISGYPHGGYPAAGSRASGSTAAGSTAGPMGCCA